MIVHHYACNRKLASLRRIVKHRPVCRALVQSPDHRRTPIRKEEQTDSSRNPRCVSLL